MKNILASLRFSFKQAADAQRTEEPEPQSENLLFLR